MKNIARTSTRILTGSIAESRADRGRATKACLALGLLLAIGNPGSADATTATFNLGASGSGMYFGSDTFTSWSLGVVPAGSFLQSVSINATIETTNQGNWASELMFLVQPNSVTPGSGSGILEIGPDWNADPNNGVTTHLFWPASANTDPISTVANTKFASTNFPTTIDLSSSNLFLMNAYGPGFGTWSGSMTITYGADAVALTWKGADGTSPTQWSTAAGVLNWDAGVAYTDGSTVIFDDTVGAGSRTVDISVADVTPTSATFNNTGANTYTLTGTKAIAGASTLTKQGDGLLIVGNANTYSGNTIISEGALKLGVANALPHGAGKGNVIVIAAGTLDLNGQSPTLNGLIGTGTVTSGVAGSVTLTLGDADTSATFSGVLQNGSGTVGLTKIGTGTQTLGGANTYSGVTNITAGTLVAANNTALGIGGHNGGTMTFIQDGATLAMQGGISLDEHFHVWGSGVGGLGAVRSISGNNALTNAPGGAAGYALRSNTTVGVAADTLTVSGFYNGDGGSYGITKIGAGTLTLTAANTYTGATNVTGGTLSISVVSGAARRFDASQLALGNSANVTTWTDLSGNGANATVPGGNANPTFIANANTGTGLGAINFLGNNNANDSQALSFSRDTNVRSVFSIFKGSSFLATDNDNNSYSLHRPGDTNPADPLLANYGQLTYLGNVYVNGTEVSPTVDNMPTGLHNGYNLVELITNGNAIALDSFNKDRTYHSGNQSQAEVILFDTVVSEAKRLQVEAYLNKKWFGTGAGVGNLLPTTTPVTISGGGTFDISGENYQTVASLSGTDASGTKINLGASALTFGDANNNTFDGVISGAGGSLIKQGNGTQILTGANTYTGATTISGGTLQLGVANALPHGAGKGNVIVSAAGTLDLNGQSPTLNGLIGTGTVTSGVAGSVTLTLGDADTSATFSGVLQNGSGTVRLTKIGTGTQTLTGANTYTGATNVTGGTLSISAVGGAARRFDASQLALSNSANVTTWTDLSGNGANATVPGGNANPTFIANAGTGTGLGAINFLGNTNANDSQALSFSRDTNVRSVFSIFKGSSFLATDSIDYPLHRPGDTNAADPLLAVGYPGTVYVNGSTVNPYASPMPTGSNNGYNLVELIGNGTPIALDSFNKDRTYHSGNQSQAEVILFDTVVSEAKRLQVEAYLNKKWFGIGAGVGNLLATTTPVTISGGGTFDISGENYQTVASLSGTDASGTKINLGASALTFGDANNNTFDGVISGAGGSLIKQGNGTQILTGTNTYTGTTTVSAGTLLVSGSISGSTVTVQSGGTLGTQTGAGGGTVGPVTVQSGGTLAPGASTGLMTVNGNLVIASGGILATEVNATGAAGTNYDRLSVNGTVNITGSTLTLSGSFDTLGAVTNDLFYILLNDSTDTNIGTFNGVAEGGHVYAANGQDYLISYQADLSLTTSGNFGTLIGNDIALMAVPEPGAVVSLLGGLGVLLGMRRRRNA